MTRRELARQIAPLLLEDRNNDKLIQQLAALLVEEGRVNEADLLMSDVALEMEKLGHSDVEVKSAHKLSADSEKELVKMIKELTAAKSVKLNETIDQSLIGGVVATTPSVEIDLSVRSKLKALGAR